MRVDLFIVIISNASAAFSFAITSKGYQRAIFNVIALRGYLSLKAFHRMHFDHYNLLGKQLILVKLRF